MAQQININDSTSLHPTGYADNSGFTTSTNASYQISNGYTDSDSDTYARLQLSTGGTGVIYYTFDNPAIPQNATITSVTATAKVRVSSTQRVTNTSAQLYSGSTAKGSSVTFATTSTSTITTLTPGTWTTSELTNIKLRIGAQGSTSGNQTRYVYFYGATLTINYSVSGWQYTITATSSDAGATVTPATQDLMEGETGEIQINCDDITEYSITDNDMDISDQLVRHAVSTGGTVTGAVTNATTGGSFSSGSNYANYPVGYTAENPNTYSSNMYASSGNTAYVNYTIDLSSIPSNATITNVEVRVSGRRENSTTDNTHMAEISLYSGSTQKGTSQEFTSTNDQVMTIDNPGTWTYAELQSAVVRFTVAYYGGRCYGISFDVTYTIPNIGNQYYWTYTVSNIEADHLIVIEPAGAYIPPEEDPEYTYQSITISSINATTTPGTGTTRIIDGSNQVITISPSDPQLTLALDNGVDITSQLVGGIPTNTYTIATFAPNADYGFSLNQSTGYYVSTNDGVNKSASVARLNMNFESDCLVTIQYINYAEASYDYGMFGKLDTAVATDGLTASSNSSSPSDSTSNYQLAMASNSNSTQTITYTVPAGEHFIDIKYGKDDASDSGNDNLQWKVLSVEATSAGGDYTYTLTNVTQSHSLIFVFGDVSYYFINSSGTGCRLFPDGSFVKLPGDNYKLNIIPDNISDTVTITDNNVDVTASLIKETGTDKSGQPAVSYSYALSNIQTTHNLVITSTFTNTNILYLKDNNDWVAVVKLFVKSNDRWVEQALTYLSDQNIQYLKKG